MNKKYSSNLKKRLKKSLKINKQFNEIFDLANVAVIKLSKSGKIRYANRLFMALLNIEYEQLLGQGLNKSMFVKIIDDKDNFGDFINRSKKKEVIENNFVCEHKSLYGKTCWIWWTAKPAINKKGKYNGCVITGIDISKQRMVEEQIVKKNTEIAISNKKLLKAISDFEEKNKELSQKHKELVDNELIARSISEHIPLGLYICDNDGNNEFVNREYCKLSGLHYKNAQKHGWEEAIHKDDLPMLKQLWEDAIKQKNVEYGVTYRLVNVKTSEMSKVHSIIKEIRYKNNETKYIGVVENVTQQEKLLDQLRNYELIIRNSSEQMSLISKDLRYMVVNDAYLQAHDLKRKNIEGITVKSIWGNKIYNEILKPKFEAAFLGNIVRYQQWFTYRFLGRRYMDVTYQPVFSPDGSIDAITVNTVDITDLKDMQMELEKSKDLAEHANKSKSEFLANMSHEIRTPLNSVIGFTELLEDQITDLNHKKYLKSIKAGGNALVIIINDILDLSKIEAGRMELNYDSLSFSALLEEISQIFSIQFDNKNLEFETDLSPNLPQYVLLDEIRVRQILFNLVGNAVKFTEKGGVKLSIKECWQENNTCDIKIEVLDSGIGIPQSQQNLIFGAFKQQSGLQTRKYGGTGLGLTISKKLVEAMNGTIHVESTEGQYSKFTIIFKDVQLVEGFCKIKPAGVNSGFEIKFKKATIVLIDKDIYNRNLLKENFLNTNIDIITANSGSEGIDAAIKNKSSLILLDVNVKYNVAYKILDDIKSNEILKNIPVVAMSTGIISPENSKFDDYLSKPIKQKDLMEVLCKYLKYTKKRKQHKPTNETYEQELSTLHERSDYNIIVSKTKQFHNQWIKVTRDELSDDIEKFANELEKFGEYHNIKIIYNYAIKLQEHLSNFDLAELSTSLKEFELIRKKILMTEN